MLGNHHLHVRKRMYKHLEPFPAQDALKRWFDRLMYLIAIGGPLAMLPQVIQLFATKDAVGLSLLTWSLWLFFSIAWFIYSIIHRDIPIMIAQGMYILFHIVLIAGIITYG